MFKGKSWLKGFVHGISEQPLPTIPAALKDYDFGLDNLILSIQNEKALKIDFTFDNMTMTVEERK